MQCNRKRLWICCIGKFCFGLKKSQDYAFSRVTDKLCSDMPVLCFTEQVILEKVVHVVTGTISN